MDTATINSIRRKIASLERMTVANGCTPAEAANAHQMAARLRTKLPNAEWQTSADEIHNRFKGRFTEHPPTPDIHDYWAREYFREFRQPLRERQQRSPLNQFDELLRETGAFGKVRF